MASIKAGSTVGGVAILTALNLDNLDLSGNIGDYLGTDQHGNRGWFDPSATFSSGQGAQYGYAAGGFGSPPSVEVVSIDQYPFAAPFVAATDVGDHVSYPPTTKERVHSMGFSSDTEGFYNFGFAPPQTSPAFIAQRSRFPFTAPFVTATNILTTTPTQSRHSAASHSAPTEGWITGGVAHPGHPTPAALDVMNSYTLASPYTTFTDEGNLSEGRQDCAGTGDDSEGFISGGKEEPSTHFNVIDKFPYSSPFSTATDHGDLSAPRYRVTGANSLVDTFITGGRAAPPTATLLTTVDKFPFSVSPVTATDQGDLGTAKEYAPATSSSVSAYVAGATTTLEVESFPFSAASGFTATEVGDLLMTHTTGASMWY